jgi:predicted aspartyl protease
VARPAWLALLLLALAACAAAPPAPALPEGCRVTTRAELPVENTPAGILLPTEVAGERLRLLVDTGANNGVLVFADVAQRLRLSVQPGRPTMGVAGALRTGRATGVEIALPGGISGRAEVTVVAAPMTPRRPDGLAGTRLFAAIQAGALDSRPSALPDLEFDPAAGRLRLHEVSGCAGFSPFGEPHEVLPLAIGPGGLPGLRVRLNGQPAIGLLDTGADRTVLLRPAIALLEGGMALLAQAPGALGADVSGTAVPAVPARVREFVIGETVLRDFTGTLVVAPVDIAHLLVGRDWIAGRRLWISYATGRVFIARERPGGLLAAR